MYSPLKCKNNVCITNCICFAFAMSFTVAGGKAGKSSSRTNEKKDFFLDSFSLNQLSSTRNVWCVACLMTLPKINDAEDNTNWQALWSLRYQDQRALITKPTLHYVTFTRYPPPHAEVPSDNRRTTMIKWLIWSVCGHLNIQKLSLNLFF